MKRGRVMRKYRAVRTLGGWSVIDRDGNLYGLFASREDAEKAAAVWNQEPT